MKRTDSSTDQPGSPLAALEELLEVPQLPALRHQHSRHPHHDQAFLEEILSVHHRHYSLLPPHRSRHPRQYAQHQGQMSHLRVAPLRQWQTLRASAHGSVGTIAVSEAVRCDEGATARTAQKPG